MIGTNRNSTSLTYEEIKQAAKDGYLEAMFEYEQYRHKRISKKDPDLISTREAHRLRGRRRVELLVLHQLLPRTSSGRNKYVSRAKLIELDKVSI